MLNSKVHYLRIENLLKIIRALYKQILIEFRIHRKIMANNYMIFIVSDTVLTLY